MNKYLRIIGITACVGGAVYFIWKYAPEPTLAQADVVAQETAQRIVARYEQECGVDLKTPVVMVDNLYNRVDVADKETWSITVDRERWNKARDNVLNDTIPHGVVHLIRNTQLGYSSMIHDAEFQALDSFLRGHISSLGSSKNLCLEAQDGSNR